MHGKILREQIKLAKLRQADFADLLEVHLVTLHKYMKKEVLPDHIITKSCAILKLDKSIFPYIEIKKSNKTQVISSDYVESLEKQVAFLQGQLDKLQTVVVNLTSQNLGKLKAWTFRSTFVGSIFSQFCSQLPI